MEWRFELKVNPASIGTAQQKRFDPRTRRFFTPKRVKDGMRAVAMLAMAARRRDGAVLPEAGSPVRLGLEFRYTVPFTVRRRKDAPKEGEPCTSRWTGDCDNRAKAVIDALTQAGMWPDDQFVTRLEVSKRWTLGEPGIAVAISEDAEP